MKNSKLRRIDGHVHIIGDGSSGSGCWLTVNSTRRRLQAYVLLREIGLSASDIGRQLDRLYVERLLEQVQNSSLDAILILAQELPRNGRGEVIDDGGPFYVPNDHVLKLAEEHPEFVPAVSIHPARSDANEELERCLQAGARVMKCLPSCQNIDCNERRYAPFWERMAKAGMLLLAHTGGEMTLPVVSSEFADPRILTLPLECGVTVIAAHGAGRSCLHDPDYTEVLIELMRRHPNLFTDNSALCTPIRSGTIAKLFQPGVVERVIHGSDYPIPVSGLGPWARGRLRWKDYREGRRETNVIERDYRLKRAIGFPERTFTRLDGLIGD